MRIEVFTDGSACTSFDGVDVDEGSEVVRIAAFVERRTTGGCTDDYTVHRLTVELQRPLGDRRLVGCSAPASGLRAPDRPPGSRPCAEWRAGG